MEKVVIVDYGMGNIRSLRRAFERAGRETDVTDDPKTVEDAARVVIPGQGAFGRAMERIEKRGLVDVLRKRVERQRPLLGVCLGLQLLYESSAEAPGVAGLGVIPGQVELLPVGGPLKRPHMGWSSVRHRSDHPVFAANPDGESFYFVHSYAAKSAPSFAAATSDHGGEFIAAIAKGTLAATQFHPEKSQDAGARLISAWLATE